MSLLNLDKKIQDAILNFIDKKFGDIKIGGITIDKLTDVFQSQENKIRDLELRLDALEHFLKKEANE